MQAAPTVTATSWSHKFVCLHCSTADRVPTTQSEKLTLEEAGLGEKMVTIPDLDCSPATFQSVLVEAYPKLEDGGGFELLRCKPKSRDLILIASRVASTPRYVRTYVIAVAKGRALCTV